MSLYPSFPVLSFLLLGACADKPGSDSSEPDVDPDIDLSLSDCSSPIEGLPWGDTIPVEGGGEIDEELAGLDLQGMAAEIDISEMLAIYRGMLAYALEISAEDLGDTLNRDTLLANEPMGPLVLGSILLDDSIIGMDVYFFRRGLQQYYTCSQGFPLRIEAFKELYWDWTEADAVIVDSTAKCGDRWLYTNADAGVFIAESRTEGPVRETEILLSHSRQDGNLDFLVYNEAGDLTDRSQFPTIAGEDHVVTGSPYVCMSCHLNSDASDHTWAYDTLVPTTGPCAF